MNCRISGVYLFSFAVFIAVIAPPAPWLFESSTIQDAAPAAKFDFAGNAAEIPVEFQGNLIFLPVKINGGQPSLFELDTTAAYSSMDPARAAELGLAAAPSATAASLSPGADLLRNPLLELPGVRIPISALPFFERRGFDAQVGRHYQGALGKDFLERVIVEIDFHRHTVRLFDPDTYKYAGKGITVPVNLVNDIPVVHAKFDTPRGKTLDADFELSTAVDDSIVFSGKYEESHGLVTGHLKTIPAYRPEWADSPRNALGRLKQFQLGGTAPPVDGPLVVFTQKKEIIDGHPNVAGIIGGGFLHRFTVILDYPHHQLILEPHRLFNEYEEADMSGLSLVARGNNLRRFEVIDVQPGSPAASSKIQIGDVIAGVDNEPAADLTLLDLRALFRQIPHKYKIIIERNDKTIDLQVSMHRLL
jgi:hypothetical protein